MDVCARAGESSVEGSIGADDDAVLQYTAFPLKALNQHAACAVATYLLGGSALASSSASQHNPEDGSQHGPQHAAEVARACGCIPLQLGLVCGALAAGHIDVNQVRVGPNSSQQNLNTLRSPSPQQQSSMQQSALSLRISSAAPMERSASFATAAARVPSWVSVPEIRQPPLGPRPACIRRPGAQKLDCSECVPSRIRS